MIAASNTPVSPAEIEAYPAITTGMKVASRREAVEILRESLTGYLWNEDFEKPAAAKDILSPPDDIPTNKRQGRASGGVDLTSYFGESAKLPLLTHEQEVFYFRRMNFVRWRAEQALNHINPTRPSLRALRQIVDDLTLGDSDRNLLAEHNLRLVIPIAHRIHMRSENVWDYVSEGNAALLRAIRGFDYGRGFRFSTYATWAIMNSLQRLASKQHRQASRYMPTDGVMFDGVESDLESEVAETSRVNIARNKIEQLLGRLDQRSQKIIKMRFGLGSYETMTLAQIGEHFGVSKERIRQIEIQALKKMSASESKSRVLGV